MMHPEIYRNWGPDHAYFHGLGWIWWIVGVVVLVLLIVILLRYFSGEKKEEEKGNEDPLKVLKGRYAKGEITKEQFESLKAELKSE